LDFLGLEFEQTHHLAADVREENTLSHLFLNVQD